MIETVIYTTLAFVIVLYFAATYLRDSSIMDIFWGIGFILIGAQSLYIAFHNNLDVSLPKLIACFLVLVWGIRLSWHIAARHTREDARYVAWRESWGVTYWWRSLLQIFILQGVLMFVIMLPVVLLNLSTIVTYNSIMLWSGVGVWLIGFIFESISDTQMAKFKKNHLNKGKLLTNGLWKYSRHPNYFGEVVQWWGIFLVALSAGTVAWYLLIIGPCVISLLIRFVSGVPLAESRMKDRVEFKHYASKTNALIPWFAK